MKLVSERRCREIIRRNFSIIFHVLFVQALYMPRSNNSSMQHIPPKIHFFGHFSLGFLSPHPRPRRGAERTRQGEGRWSRPSKTALDRSDFTEKFQVRESHTEAETKKSSSPIPVLSKQYIIIYSSAITT